MKVIYDGECAVCLSLKDYAEKRAESEDIEFIPYQSEAFEKFVPELSREQTSQALYSFSM